MVPSSVLITMLSTELMFSLFFGRLVHAELQPIISIERLLEFIELI